MSEIKMKPVWRENIGNGIPKDATGTVFIPNSVIPIDSMLMNLERAGLWRLNVLFSISFYETNRTKESKL